MAIQGLRDTSNFVADQRPKNWREGITVLYPNGKAPLTALVSVMKSRVTDDAEFNWWEKSMPVQRFTLDQAITSSQTTIHISDTNGWKEIKAGHVLLIEHTREQVRVSADPSGNTIPVSRGFAGTSATAIANISADGVNPKVWIIGTAYEENSLAPTGISYDPTKGYNYTQIFRDTLEMSRTASKTKLRTPDAIREAKRETLEIHSIQQERAYWLGSRSETTLAGKPIRTTGGIFNFIDSGNVVDIAGAATDLEDLEGYMERMFRYGSSEKMVFCGNLALLAIQRIIRKNSTWNMVTGEKEFGMRVNRLISPFGELVMKTHPLWNLNTGGTTGASQYYGMNSWFCVLDMAEFKYVYLTDSDTKYQPDIGPKGMDGIQSGYLTEAGLETGHPTTHFLLKGLVTAAKDS